MVCIQYVRSGTNTKKATRRQPDTLQFLNSSTIVSGLYGTFLFHLYKLHTFSVENLKEIIKGDNPYFKPFEKPPKGFYKLKKLELITLILKA